MTLPAGFRKSIGPGLMWAATAIGVSHLVQSTRAGALAGFGLSGVILLALVLKYPFFEFGPRYAAATGRSLVEGYRRIGSWALWSFFLMTLVTAVIRQVAIVLFMVFLIKFAFGIDWPVWLVGGLVYLGCAGLLLKGRFRALDLGIKIVVALLAVSTIVAAVLAAPRAEFSLASFWPAEMSAVRLGFLLALVGFMPSAIESSVMSSLWILAKDRTLAHPTSVEAARLDFGIAYVATGLLAFAFLLLGAAVMYGTGEAFSSEGTVFSTQLVELYAAALGGSVRIVVLVALLTTIFSTTLMVLDGFPRIIDRCLQNLGGRPEPGPGIAPGRGYTVTMVAFGVLTLLGLSLFTSSLTPMIDFAAIVTFSMTPVLGYLNLRAVTSDDVPPEARPGRGMLVLSYLGLVLLGGTTVVYLISRLLG